MTGAEEFSQEQRLDLVQVKPPQHNATDPLARAHRLPCCLVLEAPIVDFTVGTLLELQPGDILETAAQHNEDLMLQVNGQRVGTVKFDVTRERLAVRLTGLA